MPKARKRVVFRDHPRSKVFLSPIEKKDVDRVYQWVNDPEVSQFVTLRFPMTRAQEEVWCAGSEAPQPNPMDVVLGIVEKGSEQLIGSLGLHRINWINRTATTGTMIGDKRYWSKGYGSHAKLLLLKYAFDDLALNAIESRVYAFNGRSAAYGAKCGYREAGRLAKRVWHNGTFHDELILEVLPELFAPVWTQFEKGRFDRAKRRT